MRKYLRAMARAKMEKAGLRHINKPMIMVQGGVVMKGPSYFSRRWREWVDK